MDGPAAVESVVASGDKADGHAIVEAAAPAERELDSDDWFAMHTMETEPAHSVEHSLSEALAATAGVAAAGDEVAAWSQLAVTDTEIESDLEPKPMLAQEGPEADPGKSAESVPEVGPRDLTGENPFEDMVARLTGEAESVQRVSLEPTESDALEESLASWTAPHAIAASVLESVAARVRAGQIQVPSGLDGATDASVVAAVLASMLVPKP